MIEDRINITKGSVCLISHLERVLLGYTIKSGQTMHGKLQLTFDPVRTRSCLKQNQQDNLWLLHSIDQGNGERFRLLRGSTKTSVSEHMHENQEIRYGR